MRNSAVPRFPRGIGAALLASIVACGGRPTPAPPAAAVDGAATVAVVPAPAWDVAVPLGAGETYVLEGGQPRRTTIDGARALGLLDVDLSDEWAPFIFSESDGPDRPVKPNAYRATFVALANDRRSPEEILMETPQGVLSALSAAGVPLDKGAADTPAGRRAIAEAMRAVRSQREHNYLEAYGIPPTLSVLLARIDEDRNKACLDTWDAAGLDGFDGTVTFQSREQAKQEYTEALADAAWVDKMLATEQSGADATTGKVQQAPGMMSSVDMRESQLARLAREQPRLAGRIERYRKGQARLRAVRSVQSRLICEGLLSPRTKYVHGHFDLATNEALAAWERKNDIFGWGFIGGETQAALLRPAMDLHRDTFGRILMERIADSAGIVEDGSVPAVEAGYLDGQGQRRAVDNLLGAHTDALLAALGIQTMADVERFLRTVGRAGLAGLHVAFKAPPLPPYYEATADKPMELSVEIDRGDVWYELPFDQHGKPVNQPRANFPSLTLFVTWREQRIPLVRWRTTIGSWRSEAHPNGKVYYRYKVSDVGPRVWRDIVAAPVWIPPDTTPAKDLLTRKTLDRDLGPVTVVNTDVMGPGFQSAYGLVLAIHHLKGGGGFSDNQIRTHGSVDYTSIARRFSHGCHRLVNSRAVRLFDFILRRRPFDRSGNQALSLRRRFAFENRQYEYVLDTRGYYYVLKQPIPVVVTEGRIMGKLKRPIEAWIPKPGVDYRNTDLEEDTAAVVHAATERVTPAPSPTVTESEAANPSEKAEKQAQRAGENPSEEPPEKVSNKAAEKVSDKAAEKPVEKVAEKPAEKAAEKPAEKVAEKPVEKVAEKPVEKVAERPAENPTEKPAESAMGKSAPKTTDDTPGASAP